MTDDSQERAECRKCGFRVSDYGPESSDPLPTTFTLGTSECRLFEALGIGMVPRRALVELTDEQPTSSGNRHLVVADDFPRLNFVSVNLSIGISIRAQSRAVQRHPDKDSL